MKKIFVIATLIMFFMFLIAVDGFANELTGYMSLEGTFFVHDATYPDQKDISGSLALQPEYFHEWSNGLRLIFTPFARVDSADDERTHFDVRELNVMWEEGNWAVRAGLGKVFWGATEFVHLVDIINQTDLVEDWNEESKLGQPMVQITWFGEYGGVDLYLLPGFRERTFPGREGRFRTGWAIDTENPEYESSAGQTHIDVALRYSVSLDDMDIGLYQFIGTDREPLFIPIMNASGEMKLRPYYVQISQTGLDLQWILGSWLLKAEALYRTGQNENFYAFVSGFEYTFVAVADTKMDLGLIGEFAFDERDKNATNPFQKDVMGGFRIALNDMNNTEVLAGLSYDLDYCSKVATLEASRRIFNRWKIKMESGVFFRVENEDVLYDFRNDDYIKIGVSYFF